jgi:iron complex outermembrane receptor protein
LQLARFAPTNRNSVRLRGGEIQMNYEPSNRWQFYVAYSRLHNREPSTPFEQAQYARNSGALGLAHTFSDGWAASLAAYASSGDGIGQTHYGRQDMTISKTFGHGTNTRFATAATIRHLANRSSQYSQGYGTTIEGRYDNAMQYLLTFRLAY